MKTRSLLAALAIPAALATILAMTGCAASSSGAAPTKKTLSVVASTNVYGDIASQIGGKAVDVTSIMTNPAQDPHSFEASARNQLELSQADVVIENGGGYDDFVGEMLKTAKNPNAKIINVVDLSGFKPDAQGDINEHVWYDFQTVKKLTSELVATLSKADPTHASTFATNGASFDARLKALEATQAGLKSKYSGDSVSITEPVPLYMLDAIGLVNKTPPAFSHAVEEGTDVSAEVLSQTVALYSTHTVKLLAYNEQTSGPETQAVLSAAKKAGVPVVPVTETLPVGDGYIQWMTGNLAAISKALAQ